MTNKHAMPRSKRYLQPAMFRRFSQAIRAPLIAAVLAGASAMVAASAPPLATLKSVTGTWRVVAVRVATTPVQALVPNDPSYMGALLDVSPTRLSWRRPHKASSLSFTCSRPRVVNSRVSCRNGDFGPPGSRVTQSGKRLAIEWYDGATLILERAR